MRKHPSRYICAMWLALLFISLTPGNVSALEQECILMTAVYDGDMAARFKAA